MAKVVAIKQSADKARGHVTNENWYSTVVMESDDLCADIREVRTVVSTAAEAWSEDNEHVASSCVGVLDMIDYKLKQIESAAQKIFDSARVPKLPKIQKGARS